MMKLTTPKNETLRVYLIVFLSLLLAGCSFLSPVKNDQTNYLLAAQPANCIPGKGESSLSILVMQPETIAVYNTREMAYTTWPYQIAYFSKNQWAETPSQMLQPLIVATLENTHYFHAVITPPFIGQYDYVLKTQILMLLQDFTVDPPLLRLAVRAELAKTATNRVIATREFIICEPMPQRAPYAGVLAANHATAKFLNELAQFCLESINECPRRLVGEG